MLSRLLFRSAHAWRTGALLLLGTALLGLTPSVISRPSRIDAQPTAATAYGDLPLSFEANQGQTDPAVDFVAHGRGSTLLLSGGDALLSLPPTLLRVQLEGAEPHPRAVDEEPLLSRPPRASSSTRWAATSMPL